MNGVLFKYGSGSAQLAFKTPARKQHTRCPAGEVHLVLVGGLTDGLLFAPYAAKLAAAVADMGWSLIQAQLTSSYQGWGLASLDQDASELQLLSKHLQQQHNSRAWVLMGHSTGCQDAVRYVQRHQDSSLAGVILQAPVSDREYLGMFPNWQGKVPEAQELVQLGRGEEVVYRVMAWDGAAVTARRLVALCCKEGDDDMFSTDLTLPQLQDVVGVLQRLPCLILQSGADEAVPEALAQSGAVHALGQRLLQAVQLGPHSGPEGSPLSRRQASGDPHSADSACNTTVNTSREAAADEQQRHLREEAGHVGGCWQQAAGQVCMQQLPQRLQVIEGAGHACLGHEDELAEAVCSFLSELPLEQLQS